MVARNAPRWLQMLVKHGFVPAHARPDLRLAPLATGRTGVRAQLVHRHVSFTLTRALLCILFNPQESQQWRGLVGVDFVPSDIVPRSSKTPFQGNVGLLSIFNDEHPNGIPNGLNQGLAVRFFRTQSRPHQGQP